MIVSISLYSITPTTLDFESTYRDIDGDLVLLDLSRFKHKLMDSKKLIRKQISQYPLLQRPKNVYAEFEVELSIAVDFKGVFMVDKDGQYTKFKKYTEPPIELLQGDYGYDDNKKYARIVTKWPQLQLKFSDAW